MNLLKFLKLKKVGRSNVLKLKGIVNIKHFDRNKNLIAEETFNNTITNAGLAPVSSLLGGLGGVAYKWLALGTSSTAATVADTLLAAETTETGLARTSVTSTQVTTNQTNDTFQLLHTFMNNSTGSVTLQEVGIFNTSTANTATLLGRQTYAAKTLASSETLQTTYKIVIA